MTLLVTLSLAVSASAFYVGASFILKQWSVLPLWLGVVGLVTCLVLACLAEIAVLQRARFAEVVVLIIALEVGMAVALSQLLLGEGFGLRDAAGILLLLVGASLLLWQPQGTTLMGQKIAYSTQSQHG